MPGRSPAPSASARSPLPGGSNAAPPPAARPPGGAATKTGPAPPAIPPSRPRREFTIYECPDCGQRLFGEQRCPDRGIFATRLGTGEPCPHRGEPVTITDLLQEVVTTPGNR
jgi:hypothetical protein